MHSARPHGLKLVGRDKSSTVVGSTFQIGRGVLGLPSSAQLHRRHAVITYVSDGQWLISRPEKAFNPVFTSVGAAHPVELMVGQSKELQQETTIYLGYARADHSIVCMMGERDQTGAAGAALAVAAPIPSRKRSRRESPEPQ